MFEGFLHVLVLLAGGGEDARTQSPCIATMRRPKIQSLESRAEARV